MKTLIVYASRHGATREIAGRIAAGLPDCSLHDLRQSEFPDLAGYDCVILGSPLIAGMVMKEAKTFARAREAELRSRKLGLFLSGLGGDENQYFRRNFSQELLDHAGEKAFLGGIYDPKSCGFLERLIIKMVAKLDSHTDTIDGERIDRFVGAMSE